MAEIRNFINEEGLSTLTTLYKKEKIRIYKLIGENLKHGKLSNIVKEKWKINKITGWWTNSFWSYKNILEFSGIKTWKTVIRVGREKL